jgi:NTE family protein
MSIIAHTCAVAFAESADDIAERGPGAGVRVLSGGRRGGIVLVLSGGGTKGFAHIGVLKALERERIPIAGIVGVSMGAIIGGLYACGYSADEIRTIVRDTNVMGLIADSGTRVKSDAGDHRPVGENVKLSHVNFDRKLKVNGPLGMLPALSLVSFLTRYTGHLQTADFNELPIPFACVATDLETGDEVILRGGNLASSIRASASIPGLMEPWPIDGRLLVDGGLVANVPVLTAKKLFPGYPVVAVNLAGENISKPRERFKSVLDVMMQTIDIMTIDRIKANEAAADLVLYPAVGAYGMLDPTGYDDIFRRGLRAADENADRLVALSASSRVPPEEHAGRAASRVVRDVRVEGLHSALTEYLQSDLRPWIGKPFDLDAVNDAQGRIAKLDEVASVDVDTVPSPGDPSMVDVVFSVEKRPAFEFGLDGYTASFHAHRWISLNFNARDLASYGDAANLNVQLGNNEWNADARYFTPLRRGGQWGISLSGARDRYEFQNFGEYPVDRYSMRVLHYREHMDDFRVGFGVAAEYVDSPGDSGTSWGPYLYFNRDTLDNLLVPSKGYSVNSRLWYNNSGILVSRSTLTAYVPWRSNLRFLLNFGLETGEMDNPAYRAALGDSEELISLAKNPIAGDQSAWARVGLSRDFYNSWWGAVRGEVFATYGSVMEDWDPARYAWEAGVALTFPGQLLSGRIVLVYNYDHEFVFGFSLGTPRWNSGPLP